MISSIQMITLIVAYHLYITFRIGSLEICKTDDALTGKAGPSAGNIQLLKQILDFTIEMYYPEVL